VKGLAGSAGVGTADSQDIHSLAGGWQLQKGDVLIAVSTLRP